MPVCVRVRKYFVSTNSLCPQTYDYTCIANRLCVVCGARLQGLSGERMREEVRQMVADLQLVGKEGVAAAKLSGGMKRKLR